jgi:hypothetical protein
MVSESRCLNIEPRSHILPRVIIPAYRSSYDGARVAQTSGSHMSERRAITGTQ